MEPVTHALTSIALGRAGLNKITRAATPILLVSGLAADLDWVTRLGSAATFLRGHRTATHSLVGTAVIVAVVGVASWMFGRRYSRFAIGIGAALAICAVGAGTHLVLDLLNGYGVMLLWPFSTKWYAWDLAYAIDSWILFFLIVGLLTPELFRLVLEEIGSKPRRQGRLRGAWFALIGVSLVIGVRAVAHGRALALLDSREYREQTPLTVNAFPKPSNPLLWSGVVETDNTIFLLDAPLTPLQRFDPEAADVFYKPQPSLPLNSAVASPAAVEFLSFARIPLASVQPEGPGFKVTLRDMRFESERAGTRGIVAIVHLNHQSQVQIDQLEYDSTK